MTKSRVLIQVFTHEEFFPANKSSREKSFSRNKSFVLRRMRGTIASIQSSLLGKRDVASYVSTEKLTLLSVVFIIRCRHYPLPSAAAPIDAPYSFNLLCNVLRLMPRISAARVLL